MHCKNRTGLQNHRGVTVDKNKKMLLRICVCAVSFFAAVIGFSCYSQPWYIQLPVYLMLYAFIGWDVVADAFGSIGRGQLFDENFLMALATAAAFGTQQYPEAVIVMLLYQVGELFQRYAVGRSRRAIAALMDIRPDTANVLRQGQWATVLSEEVGVGEVILVKPGERVALDGIVRKGESVLDTSALTGESVPRYCSVGDRVLSGSIVSSGVLEIEVEKVLCDSTVSKILELVEEASGKKAKVERFITRFSGIYTPAVVILAVCMAVIPSLFDGGWSHWIGNAMNFLVVSCPCALVISVPMSFFMGIGAASSKGILIKGGSYLELLNKADIFVFDKTGTLTRGAFSVTEVRPAEKRSEILQTAAIAERMSLHPIARSILAAADAHPEPDWQIQEHAGHGIIARNGQETILTGSERFMVENGLEPEHIDSGGTIVYVARGGCFLGSIEISDGVKPEAAETVAQLKEQGVATVMLTGDRYETAAAIAEQVGIDRFEAELLPTDKVACVEQLLREKGKKNVLAFVGDGINDAPVLMRADIGVAMGGIGSDAAVEAADVVLMYDRLTSIVTAKRIARRTMSIVRQNILLALGIKFLVLLLTPFGLVSIWLAIFADVGVAILAVLNAMRAGTVREWLPRV